MTRRDKIRPPIDREPVSDLERATRWADGKTVHDRAAPLTPDPSGSGAWSTPPTKRVRAVQVICDQCQGIIGAVWYETYTDDGRGLLAEAAEPGDGRAVLRETRLDREAEAEPVTFWCRYPAHGAATVAAGTLTTWALTKVRDEGKRRRGGDTPRSAVLRVTCIG